ncbi:MAG: class I SAM-dependent methyltransferase [Syntrophorhabdaceae bacterium]|nr:class I SAM-dependent methyltransferase [Syntrophorhabdaceae bacterium]
MTETHSVFKELYTLWKPVFPFFVHYIKELYRRKDGVIIEIGPFCGSIFSLAQDGIGDELIITTFPKGMGSFYRQEAVVLGLKDKCTVIESTETLSCFKNNTFDLVIFRGAFFFPHLFRLDFYTIYSLLKKGGIALMGGGFGKYTPYEIINKIGQRSKELNLLAGKIDTSEKDIKRIIPPKLKDLTDVTSDGGLWAILRK